MRLDKILHQHAAAAFSGQARDFGPDLGFGESQLRIGNVGPIDASSRARVSELCAKRQRKRANAKNSCNHG